MQSASLEIQYRLGGVRIGGEQMQPFARQNHNL